MNFYSLAKNILDDEEYKIVYLLKTSLKQLVEQKIVNNSDKEDIITQNKLRPILTIQKQQSNSTRFIMDFYAKDEMGHCPDICFKSEVLLDEKYREVVFCVECKRLYNKNTDKYVTEGIVRFEKKYYCEESNRGCMLGYLQYKDGKYHLYKINEKCHKMDLEKLKPSVPKWTDTIFVFKQRLRVDASPLFTLTHIWADFR